MECATLDLADELRQCLAVRPREDAPPVSPAAASASSVAPPADVLTPWPGLADPDHILRTVETFHHPVGSCRMRRPDEPGAAVDAAGRVFELEGLWVVDASVMARVPSANTHLATIALAERLAAGFPGAGEPATATPPSAEAT